MHHRLVFIGSLFVALLLAGCHQFWASFFLARSNAIPEETPVASHGSSLSDYVSLIDALRAAGATIVPAGELSQPFFDVTGQMIQVDGEDVQVFEFPDEATAESVTSQISPDGSSTGTTMITWIAPPHFYHSGKVIVLYVGENEDILTLLEMVLGPQVAGQ